jgi:hypothetical protein
MKTTHRICTRLELTKSLGRDVRWRPGSAGTQTRLCIIGDPSIVISLQELQSGSLQLAACFTDGSAAQSILNSR